MFTEAEVPNLRELSGVSVPLSSGSVNLQMLCSLHWVQERWKSTTVPISLVVVSVSTTRYIDHVCLWDMPDQEFLGRNWFASHFLGFNQRNKSIGEFPLSRRKIPEGLDEIATLLCHKEVSFVLQESHIFSKCAHFLSPQTIAYAVL